MATNGSTVNVPNGITVVRIAIVPVFVVLLLLEPNPESFERWIAIFLFVLASATDGLDGAVARKRNQITNLGKILDPIADKTLIGGALITLSYLGEIPLWITLVILIRELIITFYRILVIRTRVIAASFAGKLKTIFQSIAIGAVLAPFEIWLPAWSYFETFLLWLALALTIVSGAQIIWRGKKS